MGEKKILVSEDLPDFLGWAKRELEDVCRKLETDSSKLKNTSRFIAQIMYDFVTGIVHNDVKSLCKAFEEAFTLGNYVVEDGRNLEERIKQINSVINEIEEWIKEVKGEVDEETRRKVPKKH